VKAHGCHMGSTRRTVGFEYLDEGGVMTESHA